MTQTNSITDRAMLVGLNISQWVGGKHDKKVSEEVAQAHKSDVSMGRFRKLLVAKESLEKLRRVTSAARLEHYARTLPWIDNGVRILSSTGYFAYAEKMREFKAQWDPAVDEFLSQYPKFIEDARQRLNGLFDPNDYPSPSEMRRKFSFEFNVMPMPTGEDFRVQLGDVETMRVRDEIEQSVNAAINVAMSDVWGRVREVISHMVERLRAYNVDQTGSVVNPFRDSLVTNVRELLDLLPSLNITKDQTLTQFAQRINSELLTYSADELRDSKPAREQTAKAAEEILSQMGDFL